MRNIEDIDIVSSDGVRISAVHHLAGNDSLATPAGRPCVVMAHGVGATRDCGLSAFGDALAQAGTDVLMFDYRYFARSGGIPRQLVSIDAQLADYQAAIRHARTLPGIDPRRIIVWGVSLSGGHVIKVAARDPSVAAVISLTPAVDGLAAVVQMVKLNGPAHIARLLAYGLRDLKTAIRRAPPVMVPVVASPGQLAALCSPGAVEGMHAIAGPTWRNAIAARVFLVIGAYRPGRAAKRLSCPVLMQIADYDQSAPAWAATRAAAAMKATVHHYLCDHFDVYPGASFHARVVADQVAFLRRVMAATSEPVPR